MSDPVYVRPQIRLTPNPTPESAAFWAGGAEGRLLIHRCHACGRYFHPPGPVCWRCRSFDVAPEQTSGRATIAAYTVNRQPWIPGLEPPYVVAMVELEEEPDVRLITNVIEVAESDVRVGMTLEVIFEDWSADGTRVWLPLFRPVS